MQDRQSRNRIEAGSDEIEILTDTNHIRIRIVSMNDRIFVGAVTIVSDPDFGNWFCRSYGSRTLRRSGSSYANENKTAKDNEPDKLRAVHLGCVCDIARRRLTKLVQFGRQQHTLEQQP